MSVLEDQIKSLQDSKTTLDENIALMQQRAKEYEDRKKEIDLEILSLQETLEKQQSELNESGEID